jgi:hypothetical protein
MIRYKDISIPKPCSIDYESLSGDEVKRFCDSCEKHVYDFRGKDETIFNKIYQSSPKICGIFYLDELSDSKKRSNEKIYKYLLLKFISVVLFIKSFLATQPSNASEISSPAITQQSINTDSNKVKAVFKKKMMRSRIQIVIYINDSLYQTSAYPQNGYLYLPDAIKANDKIKVKIFANKYFKARTYKFNYSNAENITIKIVSKKPIRLFKRRYAIGCPAEFW